MYNEKSGHGVVGVVGFDPSVRAKATGFLPRVPFPAPCPGTVVQGCPLGTGIFGCCPRRFFRSTRTTESKTITLVILPPSC